MISIPNQPLLAIILAGTLTAFIWSIIVPLWHFPDEQAHFAQVQNYAELGHSPPGRLDLSQEIYKSEKLLGTYRDNRGINQFTYNPSFKIEYSSSKQGFFEEYLNTLPKSTRRYYLGKESPRYPPLFYYLSAIGYRLSYTQGLITRVFVTRLVSVFMFAAIIYFTFRLSRNLFPKNIFLTLTTTTLIAFHPMLIFVSAGINNDTLTNLLGTIMLYLLIRNLNQPLNTKDILLITLTFSMGILTKQLFYLFLPSVILVFIYRYAKSPYKSNHLIKLTFFVLSVFAILYLVFNHSGFWRPFWPQVDNLSLTQLINQSKLHLIKLYRETIPWYWGVYKWLGVVLPLNVIRLIKLFMLAGLFGWIKYVITKIKSGNLTYQDKQLALLWFTNLVYFTVLITWDIMLTLKLGFGHGIQGRYFFPLIASHAVLIVFGLFQLFSFIKPKALTIIFTSLIIILNLIALHTVITAYYDLVPFQQFLNHISQYKPTFAKWPYLGVYWLLWLLSIGYLTAKLVKLSSPKDKS